MFCPMEYDIIAFHESECSTLAKRFPGRLRYADSARTYLSWYSDYSHVMTTRLHGAISAMSCGLWTCLFQRDDLRVNSTVELCTPIRVMEPRTSMEAAMESRSTLEPDRAEISSFKQRTLAAYQGILVSVHVQRAKWVSSQIATYFPNHRSHTCCNKNAARRVGSGASVIAALSQTHPAWYQRTRQSDMSMRLQQIPFLVRHL